MTKANLLIILRYEMDRKIKLMIIEDERIVALAMWMQFTSLGYEVGNTISSGEEAITIVKQRKPDLLLMDIFRR